MPEPDQTAAVVAMDGPPGAGKTSLLTRIAPSIGDGCVFFTEPNTRLTDGADGPAHSSPAALSLWFLRLEQAKAQRAAALSHDPATSLLLFDRNHLGALAYCYATRSDDALPYHRARDFYTRHIAPNLPTRTRTVILLVSPQQSLARRGGAAERARWQQWFDPDLLHRLHRFYLDHAADLCPSPPVLIDTDQLTPANVLTQVRDVLVEENVPGAEHLTPAEPTTTRQIIDPMFTRTYADVGGLETLGHPVTGPHAHRGGVVQFCQLGALYRAADGRTGVWDPVADRTTAGMTA